MRRAYMTNQLRRLMAAEQASFTSALRRLQIRQTMKGKKRHDQQVGQESRPRQAAKPATGKRRPATR
jgi:hypothetical protein